MQTVFHPVDNQHCDGCFCVGVHEEETAPG